MFFLIMLAIVAWVAAHAVRLRRREALLPVGLVATALVVGTFILPGLLRPARRTSESWPFPDSPPDSSTIFVVPVALIAGTGFLALGAFARRRARRDASTDAERVLADAVTGTVVWIAAATVAGFAIAFLALVSISMMAP